MFVERITLKLSVLIAISSLSISCDVTNTDGPEEFRLDRPYGFAEIPFPADNEPTEERIRLGKKLFFDRQLSSDNSISCASCHNPDFAFADTKRVSSGVAGREGTRNTPSLMNVAYQPYLLREGGVPTLEMQVLVPVQEHNEFDMNMLDVVDRIAADPEYQLLSHEAYGKEVDAWVITRAIASYERTLLSARSRYDLFMEKSDPGYLTLQEKRGLSLFTSERTSCATCHAGPAFTTYGFANNGLYKDYSDNGRERLTGRVADLAMFKIPSIRNITVTEPYMHDGSIRTLEKVVSHYNRGGEGHQNQSPLIRPLGLSDTERADLVAFLYSLTDQEFWNSPALE